MWHAFVIGLFSADRILIDISADRIFCFVFFYIFKMIFFNRNLMAKEEWSKLGFTEKNTKDSTDSNLQQKTWTVSVLSIGIWLITACT